MRVRIPSGVLNTQKGDFMKAKPRAATPPPTGPTTESVYELLGGILADRYDRTCVIEAHPEVVKASETVMAREFVLERDPVLLKAKGDLKTAKRKATVELAHQQAEAKKVKREFEACGLTPQVRKKLIALVKLVNRS